METSLASSENPGQHTQRIHCQKVPQSGNPLEDSLGTGLIDGMLHLPAPDRQRTRSMGRQLWRFDPRIYESWEHVYVIESRRCEVGDRFMDTQIVCRSGIEPARRKMPSSSVKKVGDMDRRCRCVKRGNSVDHICAGRPHAGGKSWRVRLFLQTGAHLPCGRYSA